MASPALKRLPLIGGVALASAFLGAFLRPAPAAEPASLQPLDHVLLRDARRTGPTLAPGSDRVVLVASREAIVAVTRDKVGGKDSWFLHLANQDVYELETDEQRREVGKLLPIP